MKEITIQQLKGFIQRDFIYIVVCLFALVSCLYTILSVGDYQDQCNTYWMEQMKDMKRDCGCLDYDLNQVKQFDKNFSVTLPIEMRLNNGDKDKD